MKKSTEKEVLEKVWNKYSELDNFISCSKKFEKMDKEEQERLKFQRIALFDCMLDLFDYAYPDLTNKEN